MLEDKLWKFNTYQACTYAKKKSGIMAIPSLSPVHYDRLLLKDNKKMKLTLLVSAAQLQLVLARLVMPRRRL